MKRYLLPLLALVFLPALLHANGDPVISYSARVRSCNPIPLKVTEVQVVREDLDINVALPFTTVRVAYRLKNNSKSEQVLRSWKEEASCSKFQINGWFIGRNYNVGICTGNGLIVIDVDCKHSREGANRCNQRYRFHCRRQNHTLPSRF